VGIHALHNLRGIGAKTVSAVHRSGSPSHEPEPGNNLELGRRPTGATIADGPLIGRAQEFDRLFRRVLAAGDRQGGIVALSGEPGIGKTRLLHQIAARARDEGFLPLWSRALEGDWQPSLQIWIEVLNQAVTALRWPHGESDDPPEWVQTLAPIVPALAHAFPNLPQLGHLSAQEERFRLADAITRALHALGERQSLLIVLDDFQWSDIESLRVLQHLGTLAQPAAMLIVIAIRNDYVDTSLSLVDVMSRLRREPGFEEVVLQGLGAGEVGDLMRTLSTGTVADRMVSLIGEVTHGNPFFIQELTRHLHEEGRLANGVDHPIAATDRDFTIPESLRQVVDHRLGRLSAPTQRMLRLAAVCTDGFDFPMLRALTSLDEDDLLDAIDEAMAARLIVPVGDEVERYDFLHALVRRTLYDGWSPSRRIRLHRSLATSLEQIYPDAPHRYAAALAAHYHISASVPGAEAGVPHALTAARNAQRRFAPEQAASCCRIAHDLAVSLPAAERAEISAELALAEGNALWLDTALASTTETLLLLEEAGASGQEKASFLARAVTTLHDGGQAPELWMPLLYQALALVPPEDEITWARLTMLIERFEPVTVGIINGSRWLGSDPRATAIARASGDEELFARSLQPWDLWDREWTEQLSNLIATWRTPTAIIRALTVCGADWLYHHGEFRRARAHFENLQAISERQGSVPGQAEAAVRLGIIAAAFGDPVMAREYERKASSLVERLGRGHRLHASLWWLRAILCEVDSGNWDEIAAWFTAYIADPAVGRRTIAFDDAALAALALAKSGQQSQARALLQPLVRVLGKVEPTLWLLNGTVGYAASAVWALQASDLAAGIYHCVIAVLDAGHDDFPGSSNELSVARMAALMGNADAAHGWFDKARGHLDTSGQRPLRAMVDLDEASLLATGDFADRDRAIDLAAAAGDRFASLGLSHWAAQASALANSLVQRQQDPDTIPAGLTQRELDVLRCVARGYSDRQVSEELFVSPRTVNAHVRNILAKTRLKNRTELSIWAVEHGLVRRDLPSS
jgi:predicted ATPase/DNA-binding CsgD family transcriptional regulator